MATNVPSTDGDLMQRVASYDSKALEALYNRYSAMLYTVIKKIVVDEKASEDILIEIFVIIWRKVKYFNFSSGNVYTWLVTLARNKAVDLIRRKNNPGNFEPYTEEYENNFILPRLSTIIDPLDIKTALSIKESVESALNKLTDAQQYVLYLAYYEGLTQKEISAKLNIPQPTVKSKIKMAMMNLRDNLIKGET